MNFYASNDVRYWVTYIYARFFDCEASRDKKNPVLIILERGEHPQRGTSTTEIFEMRTISFYENCTKNGFGANPAIGFLGTFSLTF